MQGTVTATFTFSFIINCLAVPPANFPSITPVQCENQVTKESGVCMFYWSCTHVAHGVHIASCMDRFLIGSCCKLPQDTQAYTQWLFGKVTSQLPSSEKRYLQKESEVTPSTVPEITVYFHDLQNRENIGNKEVMTSNNLTVTTPREYYLGYGSTIRVNIKPNKTSFHNSGNLMPLFTPVFDQPNMTKPMDNIQSLHKPVATELAYNIPIPVDLKLSHYIHSPVDIEPSHDTRVPVDLEPSHDTRVPVDLEPSHDTRVPVDLEPHHDLRKPVMVEKPHDLRNSLSQVNYYDMKVQDEKLNKSIENYVTEMVIDLITESSVMIENASFSEKVNFDRHSQGVIEIASTLDQECGISPRYPSGRIIGGHKTRYLKWPWMVSLQHLEKNSYRHKCGAILLNRMWAATVAHCVNRKLPNEVILIVGDYNLYSTEELHSHKEMRVYLIVMHPDFNPHTFENDLALIRFYQPVPNQINIAPICLPSPGIDLNGKTTVVIGWGKLAEDGELPGYLQEAHIPIVSNEQCQAMYIDAGYLENIPESFICAGRVEGGVDSCEGDSGGPMIIKGNHGRWLLIGLISWGMECGSPRLPGVYTRVPKFVEWMKKFITI